MRTYVNTFSNVTTKVLTYSHLQSLTQGFGLGPVYAAYDTIWVKGLMIAATALPFVWFIYTGLLCLIEFKAPKWHPGLVIFIVWLLTLIMLSVTGFMGCLPILLNS